jgi:Subtilase family
MHTIAGWSQELDTLKSELGDAVHVMRRLPVVALADGVAAAVPRSIYTTPASRHTYGAVQGIDLALEQAAALTCTVSPYGNRAAMGRRGEPGPIRWLATTERGTVDPDPLPPGPWALGTPYSLRLSLSLAPDVPLDTRHPLALGTRIAALTMPVVVAGGNYGAAPSRNRLSPLARLPWTLAVGATADPNGNALHPHSAVGLPGRKGIALVADGWDPFVTDWSDKDSPHLLYGDDVMTRDDSRAVYGTSFAAAHVTAELAVMRGFVASLRRAIADRRHEPPAGIPLSAAFAMDLGPLTTRPIMAPALPPNSLDDAAVRSLLRWAPSEAIAALLAGTEAEHALQLLFASAQPMPGHAEHEVGSVSSARSPHVILSLRLPVRGWSSSSRRHSGCQPRCAAGLAADYLYARACSSHYTTSG